MVSADSWAVQLFVLASTRVGVGRSSALEMVEVARSRSEASARRIWIPSRARGRAGWDARSRRAGLAKDIHHGAAGGRTWMGLRPRGRLQCDRRRVDFISQGSAAVKCESAHTTRAWRVPFLLNQDADGPPVVMPAGPYRLLISPRLPALACTLYLLLTTSFFSRRHLSPAFKPPSIRIHPATASHHGDCRPLHVPCRSDVANHPLGRAIQSRSRNNVKLSSAQHPACVTATDSTILGTGPVSHEGTAARAPEAVSTMMVPRSYHLQQVSPSPPRSSAEKMGVRSTRSVASTSSIMRIKSTDNKENEFVNRNMALKSVTPTAPAHSKPVVIPSRTPARLATVTSTQTVRARGHNGGRPAPASQHHRPDSIPPAVAALLAVTSIPKMPPRRRKGATTDRRISMDELIEEWKQDGSDGVPSVVGSPLDLLLGRIDESDDEYGSLRSLEQEKDSITTRSISSESIGMTLPSLDLDAPSLNSNWDNLSTPESYRRSISDRREKAVQSPPKEDCILDHPLLHFTHQEYGEVDDVKVPELAISPSTSSERFRSFKSNLTASLQALRSAAKSFSNFTAPSVPPDDLLTRSLLSPKFTSEMRPKQLQGLPSPALRRYLNPQPPSISPTELSMELHEALLLDTDTEAPMIQMQTYDRRSRSTSRKRKSSDPYSEAGRAESPVPAVRQREPRENCDFLRVIVLEMNMRRVGKLDAKAVGRARIWLPPRKLSSNRVPSAQGESVPDRWIALVAEDVR